MDNKQCVKCLVCKPATDFYFIKRSHSHDTRCKACIKLYHQTRKESIARYQKARYLKKVSNGWKSQSYREKTSEQKARQYQHLKAWRAKNKEKFNKEAAQGIKLRRSKSYLKHWQRIVDQYGNQCLCCGATDRSLCFDHVVPLSLGGVNDIANGQPLCRRCNTFKGHTDQRKDYRPDKGALIIETVAKSVGEKSRD